jgi:hypothetical protein
MTGRFTLDTVTRRGGARHRRRLLAPAFDTTTVAPLTISVAVTTTGTPLTSTGVASDSTTSPTPARIQSP